MNNKSHLRNCFKTIYYTNSGFSWYHRCVAITLSVVQMASFVLYKICKIKCKQPLTASFYSIIIIAAIAINGCKKEDYTISTTDDVNIVGYLQKHIDSFSLFKQILDQTNNSAFLNAYGAYTCFAPTNSAVTSWLSKIGVAKVESVDINVLKEMVKFHLIADTINSNSFKDGKLSYPTMQGQFLITGALFSGEISRYSINRQAEITSSNIKVGNGIIHIINNVLSPAKTTIAKQLEANPNYSIFVQAMKETGYYGTLDSINIDTTKRWLTVIAESNKALADSGFTTYTALKNKYSQTGNPKDPKDSLHMYVAYHILSGIKFLGDIITATSHQTLEPQEVISTQLISQEVIVNEDIFDGMVEKGITLKRNLSDNAATNGVWHDAGAHYKIKYRKPAAVYWDLCSFPEMLKLNAFYKKQNYSFVRQNETDRPIKDIDWEYKTASNFLAYDYSTTGSLTNFAYNYDIMTISMGGPNRATWFEFTTPVIIKGRYKVWVCYRTRNAVQFNVRINGELMQRPVNLGAFRPAGSENELESIGWKQYLENITGTFSGRLIGSVDIKTTERHKLRFETIAGTNSANHIDMIHFIPIDQDQLYPRFRQDGTKIPRP